VTWGAFGTLRAKISPIQTNRATEVFAGEQPLADLLTTISIRWSPNNEQITEKWRVIHNRVIYDIQRVIHLELAQREIALECRSGLSNG
jgi:SPP1 family predicted phage head-tail adaptor